MHRFPGKNHGIPNCKTPNKSESSKMIATFNKIPGHFFEYHSLSRKNIFRNEASKYIHFKSSKNHCFALRHSSTQISHTYQRKKTLQHLVTQEKSCREYTFEKGLGVLLTWWYFLFFPPVNPVSTNNKMLLNLGKKKTQQNRLQKEILDRRCFLLHQQRVS